MTIPLTNAGVLRGPDANGSAPAIVDLRDAAHPLELDHAEFDARCNALARGLARLGFERGARIGIASNNRVEYLIAHLAIMRAGLVSVPINHKLPPETIEYIYADSQIRLTFCDAGRRALVPSAVRSVDFDRPDEWSALMDAGAFDAVLPDAGDLALIMYTSGSTGRPKGVPITHASQNWIKSVRARVSGSPGPYTTIVAAPMFHLNGLGSGLGALAAGACAVLLPQFDTRQYLTAAARYRVEVITAVPTMMVMVLREVDLLASLDLSAIRLIRIGSAPVTQALIDEMKRVFPGAKLSNAYGVSEAGQLVFGPHPEGVPMSPIACGYPLPGVRARLIDAEGKESTEGILYINSPAVMGGYLNLPEKTAEVLQDGWYRTGDLFRVDAHGFFYFVGRADDMFVCGGENIYPSSVEEMLEKHPAVRHACVVPVPDELKGMKPVAFVVRKPGASVDEAEIKAYSLRNGPAYQHPRMVVFMDELPLSGVKKVDRRRLVGEALDLWQSRTAQENSA